MTPRNTAMSQTAVLFAAGVLCAVIGGIKWHTSAVEYERVRAEYEALLMRVNPGAKPTSEPFIDQYKSERNAWGAFCLGGGIGLPLAALIVWLAYREVERRRVLRALADGAGSADIARLRLGLPPRRP